MCKKSLLMMLLLALLVPWAAKAQNTLTVCDGTVTNSYIPIYGYWADAAQHNQMIYPATELTDMVGMSIDAMTFYLSSGATGNNIGSWTIKLGETTATQLTGLDGTTTLTQVYSGAMTFDATNMTMSMVFDNGYTYQGGNLLVDFTHTAASYRSMSFLGIAAASAAVYQYSTYSATVQDFLPKNTFTYSVPPTCPKPTGLAATPNGQSATLTWTSDASSFHVAYSADGTANPDDLTYTTVTTNSYTKDNLALDADHYFWVRANCSGTDQSAWAGPVSVHIGYCVPAPTSVDGNGISNVTFGIDDYVVNNETPKATYADYSNLVGAVRAGVEATIAITFKTGFTYNTYVWVDLDNSLSFDADEVVCYGESTSSNPTTLTLNFTIPADQTLGDFRLRIGSADSGLGSDPTTANPCYTDAYGCFQDYTLRVLEAPSCLPPTGLAVSDVTAHTANISWTSDGNAWQIGYSNDNFATEQYVNVTETSYTLTGLTPETAYQVRVQNNCGGGTYSVFTNPVSFTTTVACPAPTGLAAALTPGNGSVATLSWTSDASAWVVAYKTADATDFTEVNVTENSYTLTRLTPETTYNVKVKAVCGGEDGESEWSNTITFTPTDAYQLTVNDGTSTNSYVPIYGTWVDDITKSQFIIPAENLADMAWGTINKMTFYGINTGSNPTWGAAQFEVYMTETSETTLSALADYGTMTKVMNSAHLQIDGYQMVVEFDAPYQYMGGNLMIGFLQTVSGSYSGCTWYGVTATGASMGGYGSSISQQNFLPKTTFNYEPGEEPSCYKPTGLAVNYTGGTEATISWTSDATAWNIDVNGTVTAITENPYTLTGLELATDYEVKVQANCGDNGTSEWAGPVSFTTDDCMPEDMIIVNYALTDSYGDGWNGNAILVVDETCNIVEQLTIASGNSNSGTLKVCGSYAGFYWYKGSYPGETSWVFTDAVGDTLFFGTGTTSMQTLDLLYTIDLNPYVAPSEIDVTEVTNHTAIVSWTENGTATAWQIKLVNGEVETIIDADTNPFTLTGLDAETEYTVNVRAVGSEGTSMWPCVYASFTTEIACPAPSGLTATRVTATSATLNWEGFADTYNVSYAPMPHGEVLESIDFDDSSMGEWTNIDFDGDGYVWMLASESAGVYHNSDADVTGTGYNSSYDYIISGSYSNAAGIALTPDNYLVSPQIALGGTISFWACAQDANYAAEHFGVAVSTTGNTDAADFTTIWQTTMTAKGGNDRGGNAAMFVKGGTKANPGTTRSGNRAQGEWYHYIIDLSDYSGQGYVAIRHFGCTDQFMLNVDDIVIEAPAPDVQWINLTGVTGNSVEIDGLEAETEYMWKVQANCGAEDGTSMWNNSSFTTTDFCQTPFELEATDITYNAATLTWAGSQDSYNLRYRTAEVDEEYYFYDFNAGYDAAHEAGWNWEGNIIYGFDDPIYNIPSDENFFLQMGWATTNETYIFSPELPEYESGSLLEFYYFGYSTANTFQVGYSTTTNDTLSFTWGEPIDAPLQTYTKFSEELPAGTKYVAFKATAAAQSSCIFIDNFRIYKVMAAAGEWVTVENVTEPYELTGLTAEKEYEWQIQGVNPSCDELEWVAGPSFTTPEQTMLTQTIALAVGTNWVSFGVEITLNDLKAALLEAVPGTAIKITGQSNSTNYDPARNRWSGSLTWDAAKMYMIKVTANCEIALEGMPIEPADRPVTIVNGNNYLGFPLSQNMSLTNAFAGFAVNGDKVFGQTGSSTYTRGRWQGSTLTELQPGKGYIYKSVVSESRTLVFPVSSK